MKDRIHLSMALDFDAIMRFYQMACVGEAGVLVEISLNFGESRLSIN